MRVGIGFDAHGLDDERALMLGGVHIEDAPGLSGHSDGDVLCHAVADALLGAAALGDLGEHFPASDEWKNAPGVEVLRRAADLVESKAGRIVNVDSVVIAQAPVLAPYRKAMVAAIADALGIDEGAVGVKFSTTDGFGFTGRGEGIAAFATVLLD